MSKIYKYPIEIIDHQQITVMAKLRQIIHVGLDPNEQPCIWAVIDSGYKSVNVIDVYVVGTGNPIPDASVSHLGSFNQGPFVWHVYTNKV